MTIKKPGQVVRLTQRFIQHMRGECGKAGYHLGPFIDEEHKEDCFGCSSDHVDEFEKSLGIVGKGHHNEWYGEDLIEVEWVPHILHYAYGHEDVELMPLKYWPMAYAKLVMGKVRGKWYRLWNK